MHHCLPYCAPLCALLSSLRDDISVNGLLLLCYLKTYIFLLFTYFYATSQTLTPCLQCACQTFVLVCLHIYLSVFLAKMPKMYLQYTLLSTLSSPVSYCILFNINDTNTDTLGHIWLHRYTHRCTGLEDWVGRHQRGTVSQNVTE